MKYDVLIKNLNSRNINAYYCKDTKETNKKILDMIPNKTTVGIGNSKTLKTMNISKKLLDRGNIVYDKTLAKDKDEIIQLKKKSLLTDWYITGTNAVSMQGHLVNIDHSGNRVAAMIYGPDKVIVVIGKNKIVESLEAAKDRARNHAASLNAKRAGYNPPCLKVGKCVDCKSKERVCFNHVVIEGQYDHERMTVLIVDEELGF
ncbi:lactate utilization protein [Abyssisolibacter fermentans]|uniref:lactate utilization protein n=1 Tax=Abyssisolibacter fermentans TaxID=1766203 RepID=UPI000830F90F|nr:lactate utilization protein [Abyssisolibacter fermentans]